MSDLDRVDKEQLFLLVEGSVMWGHRLKVRDRRFGERGDGARESFFTQKVVNV